MPEPSTVVPPGKGGGLLKSLNPKQKRIAAVLGIAAVLALIFLLNRRTAGPAAEEGPTPSDSFAAEGQGIEGVPPGGTTDPSAVLGSFTSAFSRMFEDLSGQIERIPEGSIPLETGVEKLQGDVEELSTDVGGNTDSLALLGSVLDRNTDAVSRMAARKAKKEIERNPGAQKKAKTAKKVTAGSAGKNTNANKAKSGTAKVAIGNNKALPGLPIGGNYVPTTAGGGAHIGVGQNKPAGGGGGNKKVAQAKPAKGGGGGGGVGQAKPVSHPAPHPAPAPAKQGGGGGGGGGGKKHK